MWESDFYNNPLVPLVIEIISQLDEIISKEDDVHKDLVNIINIVNDIFKKVTFNAEIGDTFKHFFGIKNIIFVLAVDKKQVENIVKTIYGVCEGTSDIEGYLKKFIDVEFNLPAPAYKDFIGFQLQQIVDCSAPFIETNRRYNYGEIINGNIIEGKPYNGILVDTVERLVTTLNLTLRAIEKLFMRVKLTIESLDKDDLLLIEVIFFLNALYICDKKAFDIYVNSAAYNADLGQVGRIVGYIYPYWTGVLNNFGIILSSNRRNTSIELLSKEHNAAYLSNFIQQFEFNRPYAKKINLDKYLKTYASKIEFIGSMD